MYIRVSDAVSPPSFPPVGRYLPTPPSQRRLFRHLPTAPTDRSYRLRLSSSSWAPLGTSFFQLPHEQYPTLVRRLIIQSEDKINSLSHSADAPTAWKLSNPFGEESSIQPPRQPSRTDAPSRMMSLLRILTKESLRSRGNCSEWNDPGNSTHK